MKVLIICNKYQTSDRPHLGELYYLQAHALRAQGLDVGVVAIQQGTGARLQRSALSGAWTERSTTNGVDSLLDYAPRLIKQLSRSKRLLIWRGVQTVKRFMREHGKPDIIHAHNALYPGVVAARIKREFDIRYVLTEHFTVYARRELPPKRYEQARHAINKSSYLLPVSNPSGAVLEDLFGDAVHPWKSIGNMVDEDFFTLTPPPRRQEPVFLNVGRMQPLKGQSDLLRAFAAYLEAGHRGTLRIGGDGPLRTSLMDLSRDLGVTQSVSFLGMLSREQVRDELRNADAYILSSHKETFGIPVIEALASGRPVLATRSNGPEFIMGPDDGNLVEPGDPDALKEGLVALSEALDNFDSAAIRARCTARFGKQALAQTLKSIYEEVLSRRQ